MMKPVSRAVAALLLLLVVAAAACRGQDRTDSGLEAMVASLLPRLQELSGLEAVGPVRVAARDRAGLREYVSERLAEELTPEEVSGIEASYRALGLFPDTLDLRTVLLELYSEQVMGYYDPNTGTLYVVEGVPADVLRPVVAHELVHALQDQHVDLDSLVARERGNDRQTAAQAAVEGHATLVMFALLAEEQSGSPVDVGALPDLGSMLAPALETQHEQFPVFRSAPRVIRETLLFPYLKGAGFVQSLWRARADAERPAPLDRWLPQSTEQVIHPESRFIANRDHPTELAFEDMAGVTPDGAAGWHARYENTLGELELSILFAEHLGAGSDTLARGWDGDRYRLLEAAAGGSALVFYSVWDDAASADRFADAYRRILDRRADRRHGHVDRLELAGRPAVRVIDAERQVPLESVPVPGVIEVREAAS